ncbi:MAG: hypothetical protein ACSLE5_01275 [Porticoccaceae bacterium]
MSAIDGVKLPSNASKQTGGTRADFGHQAARLENNRAFDLLLQGMQLNYREESEVETPFPWRKASEISGEARD